MQKFLALYDLHWGYERKNRHKIALHDTAAIDVALQFAKDFQPDHILLGGDALDCGCVSHHNHGKPGATEGMKLIEDAKGLAEHVIKPLEALNAKSYTYLIGNHEVWLNDLEDQIPALEGLLDIDNLLGFKKDWKVVEQGGIHKLGKIVFIHGDTVKGGEHSAKWAAMAYEANVRFGHHHTYQVFTKTSAVEANGHTGVAVPCLCKKNPGYGGGAPNRWMQGFLYGYIDCKDKTFNDYVAVIVNGTSTVNGKTYTG